MAVDKKIIDYVKKQVKAGYTPDQIRAALANSGYNQADINQAIAAGGAGAPAKQGAKAAAPAGAAGVGAPKPVIGFVLSLVGGVLILLAAILPVMGLTFFDDIFAFFPIILALGDVTLTMILGLVFAIVAIVGGVLVNMKPDNKAPGLIVLIISIIVLLMGSGFFLGAIIGIIGGALAVIGK